MSVTIEAAEEALQRCSAPRVLRTPQRPAVARYHPDGLTRTQLRDLLHRNQPAHRIQHALQALAAAGRASRHTRPTGGRPAEAWTTAAGRPARRPHTAQP